LTPLDITRVLSRSIFVNEAAHHLLSIIELVEAVSEERRFLEVLNVGLSTLQFVELDAQSVEQMAHTCVISEHHATDLVWCGHVGALLCEGNLDRGGTPWDELGKFSFTDALQRFMHLCRVDISLDDVQDGNV